MLVSVAPSALHKTLDYPLFRTRSSTMVGAHPGLRPAEGLDADVSPKAQLVAVGGHSSFVRLTGFRIVEPSAIGVGGVGEFEGVPDLKTAERVFAGDGVGVLFVELRGSLFADRDHTGADVCTAAEDLDDRACGLAPLAEDAGAGLRRRDYCDEKKSNQSADTKTHTGLDANAEPHEARGCQRPVISLCGYRWSRIFRLRRILWR